VLESGANGGHVPVAPPEFGAHQRAKREQMRAVSRWGNALLAGALALGPWAALAQEAPPPSTTPATDAVGPRELQNFSLNGTVTRQADRPVPVQPAPKKPQPRAAAQATPAEPEPRTAATAQAETASTRTAAPRRTESASATPRTLPKADPAPEPLRQTPPSSSVTVALPKLDSATSGAASAPVFAPAPDSAGTLATEHRFPVLPWLLAALVAAAAGAFLFWRNRQREAFAGGPQMDAFTAPEPAPAPAPRRAPPAPAPAPKPAAPSVAGIVSTRLRPWIEIGFQPLRCILEDQRVIVEFEIELFNSGSSPARAVLAEATLFNAGPTQDEQIGAFFANPVGEGERIVAIAPLKRVAIRTQVVAPREQIQAYELGGRQVFVPVIAFNALYRWSNGEGQTSVSYLIGRDMKSDKMAPFRLDLGPRIFRGLAAHLLPDGVRQ
jgi:hypothetical protein